jgi:hypothetical protein
LFTNKEKAKNRKKEIIGPNIYDEETFFLVTMRSTTAYHCITIAVKILWVHKKCIIAAFVHSKLIAEVLFYVKQNIYQ